MKKLFKVGLRYFLSKVPAPGIFQDHGIQEINSYPMILLSERFD